VLAILSFIGFILLMRIHSKLLFDKNVTKALIAINEDEYSLWKQGCPLKTDKSLMIFSLPTMIWIFWWAFSFQNLNRTATYIGKKTSWTITSFSSNTEIIENQEAVRAFQNRLASRFLAFAKISQDSKTSYETLLRWNTFDSIPLSSFYYLFVCKSNTFIGSAIGYMVNSSAIFYQQWPIFSSLI
jgi:hypothetical protein